MAFINRSEQLYIVHIGNIFWGLCTIFRSYGLKTDMQIIKHFKYTNLINEHDMPTYNNYIKCFSHAYLIIKYPTFCPAA